MAKKQWTQGEEDGDDGPEQEGHEGVEEEDAMWTEEDETAWQAWSEEWEEAMDLEADGCEDAWATFEQARKLLNDKRTGRGYYPVVAIPSKAEVSKNFLDGCRLCGDMNHWARDCPKNPVKRTYGGKPGVKNTKGKNQKGGGKKGRSGQFSTPYKGQKGGGKDKSKTAEKAMCITDVGLQAEGPDSLAAAVDESADFSAYKADLRPTETQEAFSSQDLHVASMVADVPPVGWYSIVQLQKGLSGSRPSGSFSK